MGRANIRNMEVHNESFMNKVLSKSRYGYQYHLRSCMNSAFEKLTRVRRTHVNDIEFINWIELSFQSNQYLSFSHCFLQLNLNINIIPKELGLDEAYYVNVLDDRKICDPFAGPPNYEYRTGRCPKRAIAIRDLPDVSKIQYYLIYLLRVRSILLWFSISWFFDFQVM